MTPSVILSTRETSSSASGSRVERQQVVDALALWSIS
jgi:hypothetical protein